MGIYGPAQQIQTQVRANTTNTSYGNVYIQFGWGFVTGAGTGSTNKSETFPTAYSTILWVQISPLAAKSASDPTGITDMTVAYNGDAVTTSAASITTSGFTSTVTAENGRILGSGTRYGYSWMAIGLL